MAFYSNVEPDPKIGTVEERDRTRTSSVAAVKLGSVVAVVSITIAYAVFHLHGGTSQMDEIPSTCLSAVSGFQMQLTLAEKNNQAAGNRIRSLLEELAVIKEQLKTAESAKNTYISELNQKDKAYRAEISHGKALMVELMASDRKRREGEADVQMLNTQIDKLRKELNQHHTTNEVAKVNHHNMERQLGEADFRSRDQLLQIENLKEWLASSVISVFIFALMIVCCCCTPARLEGHILAIVNGLRQ